MLTIPSIDIRGGKVVRLLHGRFDAETAYGEDPAAQAEAFRAAGAEWVHVVDLDGARDGAVVWAAAGVPAGDAAVLVLISSAPCS